MPVFVPPVSSVPSEFAPGVMNLVGVGVNGAGATALLKSGILNTGGILSSLWSLEYNELSSNPTDGGGGVDAAFNIDEFQTWRLTAANVPVSISPIAGRGTLILIQDAVGGRLVTWPAEVRWAGAAPALSVAANAVDIFKFIMWFHNTSGVWNYFAEYSKGHAYV